jgi:uncharacterized protein YbjT (DUF2867 family)
MILVTGGTGFIGRVLVRHLVESGRMVRTLIRPSPRTPHLPTGVGVEVAVVSLNDPPGLRSALRQVDTVYHLAGAEAQGRQADLLRSDIEGTRNLVEAAAGAGVRRIFYLSHLGADRASAFPVLKAKGIAEEHIRRSGLPYTIFRSALVFGPEDHFTNGLARLLRASPGIFLLPGEGKTLLQPLWVEDLVTCLVWALDNPATRNQTYEVGGGEYLSLRQVVETVLAVMRRSRVLVPVSPPWLRAVTVILENAVPAFPVSPFWLDYLAVDRTCEVNTLPRVFGLLPSRFSARLDYLAGLPWQRRLWQAGRQGLEDRVRRLQERLRSAPRRE